MPGLLLQMWKNADSSKGPRKDMYSTQAINKALKKAGHTSMGEQFANYSAATRIPGLTFSEGAALGYPAKSLGGQVGLPAGKKKRFKARLDHLTSETFQFAPGGGTTKLKLQLKMASKSAGSRAVVAVYNLAGTYSFKNVKINARGIGRTKVPFDASVYAVEVTLVNASIRYRDCYRRDTPYACSGIPVDNNLRAQVQGKAS